MLCIWEEQLFPAALLSGMELHRASVNCLSENQSSRHGGCLLVFASPGRCPSAALPARLHRGMLHLDGCLSPGIPRPLPGFVPSHSLIPLSKREVLQRHKSWENTLKTGCREGRRSSGMQGMVKKWRNWKT